MFGLYDYYRATNSEEALGLFNADIDSLKKYLHRYDTGYWTTYDQLRKPGYAKIRYQRYHIELLRVLHAITGEPVLHEYIVRWTGYLNRLRRSVFALRVIRARLGEILQNRRANGGKAGLDG